MRHPVRAKPDALLFAVLALALAIRLWGIADRLPDPTLGINPIVANTAVDEGDRRAMDFAWRMWRGGTIPLNLNPGTGDWPGLPFYLTLGLQLLYRATDPVTHGPISAGEFQARVERDPAAMFLFARIFDALLGVACVALVFLLGRRLAGRRLGLGASLLLALNPTHIVASQRVSDPNLLALLFTLIATVALVGLKDERRVRDSAIAGAAIGLAAASKYFPGVLILIAALANVERDGGRWKIHGTAIGAAVLGLAVAFFIASPFTLLDWTEKSHSFVMQRERLTSEWVGLSDARFSLPTYFTRTFPSMLGWPGYLLAIAGTVLLFIKRPRGWIVASVPLLLLLPTGALALAAERFILPAVGSLVVAAALAMTRVPRNAGIALLLLCVAWPAPAYLRLRRALSRPDTRVAAHRWIDEHIASTEPMAIDIYGPEFALDFTVRLCLNWPFMVSETPLVRAAYHPAFLDGFRYYTTSSEVGRRFEAAAGHYPLEAEFHRWLREHAVVVWSSDSTQDTGPRIEVRALPERISSRAERDSTWAVASRAAMYPERLGRWCFEMSSIFLRREQYDRAEEWASRGLGIGRTPSRKELLETLALALVKLDRPAEAEEAARTGVQEFPVSPLLHVDRGMALERLGRYPEAIAEFRRALDLGSSERSAEVIRAEIARLEALLPH